MAGQTFWSEFGEGRPSFPPFLAGGEKARLAEEGVSFVVERIQYTSEIAYGPCWAVVVIVPAWGMEPRTLLLPAIPNSPRDRKLMAMQEWLAEHPGEPIRARLIRRGLRNGYTMYDLAEPDGAA